MSRGSTRKWREMRAYILKRDQHTCAYCGEDANEVDHVIPVAHGGTDDEWNLVAACRRCNLKKSDKNMVFLDNRTPPTPFLKVSLPDAETVELNPETPFKKP